MRPNEITLDELAELFGCRGGDYQNNHRGLLKYAEARGLPSRKALDLEAGKLRHAFDRGAAEAHVGEFGPPGDCGEGEASIADLTERYGHSRNHIQQLIKSSDGDVKTRRLPLGWGKGQGLAVDAASFDAFYRERADRIAAEGHAKELGRAEREARRAERERVRIERGLAREQAEELRAALREERAAERERAKAERAAERERAKAERAAAREAERERRRLEKERDKAQRAEAYRLGAGDCGEEEGGRCGAGACGASGRRRGVAAVRGACSASALGRCRCTWWRWPDDHVHHWKVDPPRGRKSWGYCRCGSAREFANSDGRELKISPRRPGIAEGVSPPSAPNSDPTAGIYVVLRRRHRPSVNVAHHSDS